MDVSNVGVTNSAQYLQRAQNGLQAPLTPVKQEEQAAQVIGPVLAQAAQPPQPTQQLSPNDLAKIGAAQTGVGQVVDISA